MIVIQALLGIAAAWAFLGHVGQLWFSDSGNRPALSLLACVAALGFLALTLKS